MTGCGVGDRIRSHVPVVAVAMLESRLASCVHCGVCHRESITIRAVAILISIFLRKSHRKISPPPGHRAVFLTAVSVSTTHVRKIYKILCLSELAVGVFTIVRTKFYNERTCTSVVRHTFVPN